MKIKILTLVIVLLSAVSSNAQTDGFAPGWFLVKSGAQVKVIQGCSDDATNQIDWTQISYSANEVLLAFNFSKEKYYCYDPSGRIVLVKGLASLQRITLPGRPVHIIESVKIGLDHDLNVGNNVWLTAYNSANKTATILSVDGQKFDIPQSNIQDLKDFYDIMDHFTDWHIAE